MPKIWLTVPHQKQHRQADCLAACAAMVLAYWKCSIAYEQLLSLLDVQDIGTISLFGTVPSSTKHTPKSTDNTEIHSRGPTETFNLKDLFQCYPCLSVWARYHWQFRLKY